MPALAGEQEAPLARERQASLAGERHLKLAKNKPKVALSAIFIRYYRAENEPRRPPFRPPHPKPRFARSEQKMSGKPTLFRALILLAGEHRSERQKWRGRVLHVSRSRPIYNLNLAIFGLKTRKKNARDLRKISRPASGKPPQNASAFCSVGVLAPREKTLARPPNDGRQSSLKYSYLIDIPYKDIKYS